jgi:hypothetical protein
MLGTDRYDLPWGTCVEIRAVLSGLPSIHPRPYPEPRGLEAAEPLSRVAPKPYSRAGRVVASGPEVPLGLLVFGTDALLGLEELAVISLASASVI